ncbi:MAG: hypothetical protein ACAH95_03000 [Fimbriimonas sp.]
MNSREDREPMDATAYLMSSPLNAQRLNEAIAEHEAAKALLRESISLSENSKT